MEIVHSEYVSPCSPRVLKRWGHDVKQDVEGRHEEAFRRERADLERVREMEAKAVAKIASLDMGVPELGYSLNDSGSSDTSSGSKNGSVKADEAREGAKHSKFNKLFGGFPQTLIVVGDAERLVEEVKSLQVAMEKDGVKVQAEWVRDTVHDVLMMNQWWWDWGVIEGLWKVVGDWAVRLRE
jgi:acetyl esterase/lipase